MADQKTERIYGFGIDTVPKIHAIITARGGSKGIKRKNLYPLNGKPLIYYSIKSAQLSRYISKCFVSTEDREIASVSAGYGAEIIERPAYLATDTALSNDVVYHALERMREWGEFPDYFVLLQPTSPLRTEHHIDESIENMLAHQCNSSISVTHAEHSPYKMLTLQDGFLAPLFSKQTLSMPRNSLPPVFRQNGAIYIADSGKFLETKSFFIEPVLPYMMTNEDSIDIDSLLDMKLAELILQEKLKNQ